MRAEQVNFENVLIDCQDKSLQQTGRRREFVVVLLLVNEAFRIHEIVVKRLQ